MRLSLAVMLIALAAGASAQTRYSGPRTAEQFQNSLRAVELKLDDATLARLDEIFPGPGPAPEAWAW